MEVFTLDFDNIPGANSKLKVFKDIPLEEEQPSAIKSYEVDREVIPLSFRTPTEEEKKLAMKLHMFNGASFDAVLTGVGAVIGGVLGGGAGARIGALAGTATGLGLLYYDWKSKADNEYTDTNFWAQFGEDIADFYDARPQDNYFFNRSAFKQGLTLGLFFKDEEIPGIDNGVNSIYRMVGDLVSLGYASWLVSPGVVALNPGSSFLKSNAEAIGFTLVDALRSGYTGYREHERVVEGFNEFMSSLTGGVAGFIAAPIAFKKLYGVGSRFSSISSFIPKSMEENTLLQHAAAILKNAVKTGTVMDIFEASKHFTNKFLEYTETKVLNTTFPYKKDKDLVEGLLVSPFIGGAVLGASLHYPKTTATALILPEAVKVVKSAVFESSLNPDEIEIPNIPNPEVFTNLYRSTFYVGEAEYKPIVVKLLNQLGLDESALYDKRIQDILYTLYYINYPTSLLENELKKLLAKRFNDEKSYNYYDYLGVVEEWPDESTE